MSPHILQIMLALLMAVPLHLCCWLGLMKPAAGEESCTACHQFLTAEELAQLPAPPAPKRNCECCDGTLERGQTPAIVSAPRAGLHVLPGTPWLDTACVLLPDPAYLSQRHRLPDERPPPPRAEPLYLRHCALLI